MDNKLIDKLESELSALEIKFNEMKNTLDSLQMKIKELNKSRDILDKSLKAKNQIESYYQSEAVVVENKMGYFD